MHIQKKSTRKSDERFVAKACVSSGLTLTANSGVVNILVKVTDTLTHCWKHLISLARIVLALHERQFDDKCQKPGHTAQQTKDKHNQSASHRNGPRNSETQERKARVQRYDRPKQIHRGKWEVTRRAYCLLRCFAGFAGFEGVAKLEESSQH